MKRLVAVMALVAVPVLGACRSGSVGVGEARLKEGEAEISHSGGAWKATGSGIVRRGDRVRVREGAAVLEMDGGAQLELRAGSVVQVGRTPVLEAGDLLVVPSDRPVTVEAGGVSAVVTAGAARLARTLAFEAASYAGGLEVRSADRSLGVPALRQVSVAAPGLIPPGPSALALRKPEDPWDRRFLGEWIDLGRDLESRSNGLTGQLPKGAGAVPSFYHLLLPELEREPAFRTLLDANWPRGETVVGAAIALESRKGDFVQRWTNVFGFRAEDASWGLVALDQEVSADAVTRRIEQAVGRFVDVGREAALPPPPPPAPPPVVPPPTEEVASPPTTVRPPRRTPPAPEPPPAPPPELALPPTGIETIDTVQAPLVETLAGLLDSVLDVVGLGGTPRPGG